MNKEVVVKNKKEDKKHIVKFVLILIASFFAGMFVSMGMLHIDEKILKDFGKGIADFLMSISLYFNFVMVAASAVAVVVLYRQSRKLYSGWDEENEEILDAIDTKLNISLIIVSINQILLLVFGPIGFVQGDSMETKAQSIVALVSLAVQILIVESFVVISQLKIINFAKEINPEKRGSVFDTKFQDKWFASCDEAEKLMIYEASFGSYRAVNIVCLLLCLFCMVAMMFWEVDIVSICLVGIIWLVSSLSYCIKAMQLEKRKK